MRLIHVLKAVGHGRERTKMSILCNSKTTLFSSVFTSTSRVHMAKELQRQPPRVLVWALALAAGRFAELSVLQYALSITLFRFSSHSVGIARRSLCEGAALAGDLLKLKRLRTAHSITAAVSQCAAISGNANILQWLADVCGKKVGHNRTVVTTACVHGQQQIVQYLLSKSCKSDVRACCEAAARGGHLNLIKWMVTTEPFSGRIHYDSMMYSAAAGGSIEVMQWLRTEHDVELDALLVQMAAKCNHLAAIQYLRDEGCPWDASACSAAAEDPSRHPMEVTTHSSCETLQWLHENGCPWEVKDVRLEAAQSGDISVLAYVIQHNGVPDATELTHMLNAADAFKEIEAVKWLRQLRAK
jgi:Ankyrin repeats (3 copies)